MTKLKCFSWEWFNSKANCTSKYLLNNKLSVSLRVFHLFKFACQLHFSVFASVKKHKILSPDTFSLCSSLLLMSVSIFFVVLHSLPFICFDRIWDINTRNTSHYFTKFRWQIIYHIISSNKIAYLRCFYFPWNFCITTNK